MQLRSTNRQTAQTTPECLPARASATSSRAVKVRGRRERSHRCNNSYNVFRVQDVGESRDANDVSASLLMILSQSERRRFATADRDCKCRYTYSCSCTRRRMRRTARDERERGTILESHRIFREATEIFCT